MRYEKYKFPKTGNFVTCTKDFSKALFFLNSELIEGEAKNLENYISKMNKAVKESTNKGEELASEVLDIGQFPLLYVQWTFLLNEIAYVPDNEDELNEASYWCKLTDLKTANKIVKLISNMRMNIQDVMDGKDNLIEGYKNRINWDERICREEPRYLKLATGEPKQYFHSLPSEAQFDKLAELLYDNGSSKRALNKKVTGTFLQNRVEHTDLSDMVKSANKIQAFLEVFSLYYCGKKAAAFKKDCMASIESRSKSSKGLESFQEKVISILKR